MDVNEHEKLCNITLRHKLKEMENEHEKLSNIELNKGTWRIWM